MSPPDRPPVEWRVSDQPVAYETALAAMDERAAAIAQGAASELVWLLEHPPLYTAGTSARPQDLVEARFPVHQTGRGGQPVSELATQLRKHCAKRHADRQRQKEGVDMARAIGPTSNSS